MSEIIGIDLGTTYSAVGFVRAGVPVILPNGTERIVPSVVGFTPQGELLIGTPARNQYVVYPENTARSFKRLMGSDTTVTLHGQSYTPSELSALILREMKRVAEVNLGQPVTRAVITVPAYFDERARRATRDAGEIAGLTVERIINEPTAAALAYGLGRTSEHELIAVYDLGGGTFDVSIIELNAGVIEVRASHGNVQLGGDDFDERVLDALAARFMAEHGRDPRTERKARARLLRAAEQAKLTLSRQPFARVREEYLLETDGHPLHLDIELTRVEFEDLIADLLDETLEAFDHALEDAGVTVEQLDRTLLVGGSTRIPRVWEMLAEHTGKAPHVEVNPDEAVALGAGVQAAIIAGEPVDAILVDVTAHSLGIAVAEIHFGQVVTDRYAPVIHRNTIVPAAHAKLFHALHPDQTAISVQVYQGEAPVASRNTLLGEFLIEGLRAEVAGQLPSISVQFDLDLSGMLGVTAVDRVSGQAQSITVKAEHRRMDAAAKDAAALRLTDLAQAPVAVAPTDELAALIARAQTILSDQREGAEQLHAVLARIQAELMAGASGAQPTLVEELLDALYELEE